MATKAELEAELSALKAEMMARPDPGAGTTDADEDQADVADSPTDGSALDRILEEHNLNTADLESLMSQLSSELGGLPQNKPVLTALGAFALGFVAGRMSK